MNLRAFDLDRTLEMDPEFLDTEGEHEHDTSVSSHSCKFDGELNVNMLQTWISELIQTKSNDLFRYKGVLAVKGMEHKFVFQGVHMLFSGGFNRDIVAWKPGGAANVPLRVYRAQSRQKGTRGRIHELQGERFAPI